MNKAILRNRTEHLFRCVLAASSTSRSDLMLLLVKNTALQAASVHCNCSLPPRCATKFLCCINNFITSKQTPAPPRKSTPDLQSIRIVLPFKEQKSADSVRKQLKDIGKLLNIDLCPVFISRKVGEDLKHKEIKPALINEQSVVYTFECGWCDASYVGYTRRYLYQRIDEHKRSGSIFNHSQSQHPSRTITSNMFYILKKCSSKFDCLLYEMFLIREHKLCLNIQSDSIKAKLFT